MSSSALLSVQGLSVHYGGVTAVDGVDLDVEDGSFVGLIGPNGAGKTTLIDAIGGFCRSAGAIDFLGRRITEMSAFRRSRLGIGRTFQGGELFDDLTVLDNVTVGSYRGSIRGAVGEVLRCRAAEVAPATLAGLDTFGLAEYANSVVRDLPVGLRKLVAVARALAARPRLLLLDEPAAGLDEIESARLGEALRGLPARGTTVMLVDHDMDLVMTVCDTVHVLDAGRIIASGTGAEVQADPLVREAYLGVLVLDGAR
jgi:ABC-type branched-subunit amino acid transport system ATPase component